MLQPNALGQPTYFWTLMLKSGAMNVSERGRLCGLWCEKKEPSCNAAPPPPGPPPELPWLDTNYEMRQPRVEHIRSAPDGSGGWSGAFYGTYDPTAHLPSLPTPAELIDGGGAPAAFGANVSSYFAQCCGHQCSTCEFSIHSGGSCRKKHACRGNGVPSCVW